MKVIRGDTRVQTFCWCMTDIVLVTADEVWNGVTKSCGRPGCNKRLLRRPK